MQLTANTRFIPVVEFTIRNQDEIHKAEFETAEEMQAFVDKHRAIASRDKDGDVIPGQFDRVSDWGWFVQYIEWRN